MTAIAMHLHRSGLHPRSHDDCLMRSIYRVTMAMASRAVCWSDGVAIQPGPERMRRLVSVSFSQATPESCGHVGLEGGRPVYTFFDSVLDVLFLLRIGQVETLVLRNQDLSNQVKLLQQEGLESRRVEDEMARRSSVLQATLQNMVGH